MFQRLDACLRLDRWLALVVRSSLLFFVISGLAVAGETNSLVRNGGFEMADTNDTARPAFWDKPDGLGVQWVAAPSAGGPGSNKAIRLNTAVSEAAMVEQWARTGITDWDIPKPTHDPVGASYGLSFYSDPIPVVSGRCYRVSARVKGPAGGAKIWVRGYGRIRGRERQLYSTIVNLRGDGRSWTPLCQEFDPTARTPAVTSMRVMLYAYWPAGVYLFDDVGISEGEPEGKERAGNAGNP